MNRESILADLNARGVDYVLLNGNWLGHPCWGITIQEEYSTQILGLDVSEVKAYNGYYYADTDERTPPWGGPSRPCTHCGLSAEPGYAPDPCLGGMLDGVLSACCGHGCKKSYLSVDGGVTKFDSTDEFLDYVQDRWGANRLPYEYEPHPSGGMPIEDIERQRKVILEFKAKIFLDWAIRPT